MRTLARALLAWLAALSAGGALAAPAAPTAAALPRIVVAFANEQHAPPPPAGSSGSRYAGGGYAVGQSAQQQARRVASRYALHEVASWPIQALSIHCVVFEITDGRSVATVLAALSHDGSVVLAQPLQEFHSLTSGADARYNDPLYDLQTNLAVLGIPRAHERTQGAGVRVALIDTGVDAAHPDLTGRIARVRSFVPGPAPPATALRHGTAMAGVIAAVANNHIGIVGVAPEVRIEVFAACWQLEAASDAATCNTFTLAQALAAALASGAPLVNLSIGGPADPLLAALVQNGLKHGVVFVGAAAGADAPFPTAIPGVITASASEQPAVPRALAAPAEHILTLRPNGEYDFASGTSVAAAEITGALALLISASPTRLGADTLAALLRDSATPGGAAPGGAAADAPPVDVSVALARLSARLGAAASAGTLR
jgi:subtilisin family serine protease